MASPLHVMGTRAYQKVEKLFNAIFGTLDNPFYHLGSLSFYFFWVVLVSGIYIFFLWDTQVALAYSSVQYLTHEQWYLGGVMRSLHRYASDAAVITIILHGGREFFRDRYRGVRWFSWFTGVPTLWLVVALGISGYWLVWDQMAQYIALATAKLIDALPAIPGSMALNFASGVVTDRFFILMAFLHLLAFPVLMVFLLWTHVSRVTDVDFMPPRNLTIGTTVMLLVISFLKPAVSHEAADFFKAPVNLNLDWFYLNVFPLIDLFGTQTVWYASTLLTVLIMVVPWLPPQRKVPLPKITLESCNGCGQCWLDCPFGAINMMPRTDGRKYDKEPVIKPSLCTSCGICVGSCHYANPNRNPKGVLDAGMDMPQLSVDSLRSQCLQALADMAGQPGPKVMVFGCGHGVQIKELAAQGVAVVDVFCAGMIPPSFVEYVLKRGADGVFLTGCREGDCYYRLGNRWMDMRLQRIREPRLFNRVDERRVERYWGAPGDKDDLARAFGEFRQRLTSIGQGGA